MYRMYSCGQLTRGGSLVWGFGVGLTILHRKNKVLNEISQRSSDFDGFFGIQSLDKRLKQKKMEMRLGTWNVRSLYRAGSLLNFWNKE
jgi:hypothetical protein